MPRAGAPSPGYVGQLLPPGRQGPAPSDRPGGGPVVAHQSEWPDAAVADEAVFG